MSERMVNFAEDNGVDKLKGFGLFVAWKGRVFSEENWGGGGKPVGNDFCCKSGFYSICRKEEFVPKEVPVGRCFIVLKVFS